MSSFVCHSKTGLKIAPCKIESLFLVISTISPVQQGALSPVTPWPTPLLLPPGVPHANHVQLLRFEEGQQAVSQAHLPNVCDRISVTFDQPTFQPSLHVLHCGRLRENGKRVTLHKSNTKYTKCNVFNNAHPRKISTFSIKIL